MKKMKNTIKDTVNKRNVLTKSIEELVEIINRKIVGWRNYYKTRNNDKWMKAIDWYTLCTFTRWYNKKHKIRRMLSNLCKVRGILRERNLQYMIA